jgi:Carboxypeptidase regulatory-like domain
MTSAFSGAGWMATIILSMGCNKYDINPLLKHNIWQLYHVAIQKQPLMKTIFTLLLTIIVLQAGAQEITGIVWNKNYETICGAHLAVYQGGKLICNTFSDPDGNYAIKPLEPGYYDLVATFAAHDSIVITGIVVMPGKETSQDFILLTATGTPKSVKMKYTPPIRDGRGQLMTKAEIQVLPTSSICDLATTSGCGGVRDGNRNQGINLAGARTEGAAYIIDGIPVKEAELNPCPVPVAYQFSRYVYSRGEIDQMPINSIQDIPAMLPGVYMARRGDNISILGSRM